MEIDKADEDGEEHTYICGGTLVASKYMISAAHCVFDGLGNKVKESKIRVWISNTEKQN